VTEDNAMDDLLKEFPDYDKDRVCSIASEVYGQVKDGIPTYGEIEENPDVEPTDEEWDEIVEDNLKDLKEKLFARVLRLNR
jgi:hypothetical protein